MPQLGEAVFVPPPKSSNEEGEEPKKTISIRCSLFFDGTLNNRTNVNARKTNSEAYQATKSLWHRTTGLGSGKGDGSYENEESNIARMEPHVKSADGFDLTLKVYTEGAGTFDEQSDSKLGAATGTGSSGVISKVRKGILDAVDQIGKARDPASFVIKQLTFDVFGFSRGAAGARYCIHCLLMDERQPMKRRLEVMGFEVEQVAVQFAGLYDTVSSHGLVFSDDTAALKLDAIRHAEKVVQLAAADEHRKNFSLTNINSAGAKGEQYFLPGAHSDVGGGYVDGAPEEQVIFKGVRDHAIAERKKWIEDGWYREDEISDVSAVIPPIQPLYMGSAQPMPLGGISQPLPEILRVHRESISNAYCLIPLKIMVRFAEENGLTMDSRFVRRASERITGDLLDLESEIDAHIARSGTSSSAEFWHRSTPLLRRIRNKYLHVSSQYSLGMTPRFKRGKRYREQYDG